MPSATFVQRWTIAMILVGLLVIVATYRDYGIIWDEPVQARYGELVLDYFTSGGEETGATDFVDVHLYGPLAELIPALVYRPFPDSKFEIRHLIVALTGLLTVVGAARLGGLLGNRWIPVFAPLILALLPRFYGHAFFNSKDVPFACLFTWAVYALCRLKRPVPRAAGAAACGIAFGAVLAVRPGGAPLLFGLFALATALAWTAGAESRKAWLLSGVVWIVAWGSMIALWPWAQASPLLNPLRAMRAATAFPQVYPVLFGGRTVPSDQLPWTYVPRYLLITTPIAVLLLAAIGTCRSLRFAWIRRTSIESLPHWIVAAWLFVPPALVGLAGANVYDGLRHFLFVLPPLALLAGVGAAGVLEWSGRRRRAVAGALIATCCWPVVPLVRLHPYQMTYFNGFVGGVSGAQDRYETDYWVSSYREAAEWINEQARSRGDRPVEVLVAANAYSVGCLADYLDRGVKLQTVFRADIPGTVPEPFDYYVATTRYGFSRSFPDSPIVHTVGRAGAVFTVIRSGGP